jgi:DNA-binding response OmpR family regulator
MAPAKKTILVASRDPQQADVRKHILEAAGFEVISAMDLLAIRKACERGAIAAVVIGYSLPPAEKRRVWQTVRELCEPEVPVLELLQHDKAELIQGHALFSHEWDGDEGFAKAVAKIAKQKFQR